MEIDVAEDTMTLITHIKQDFFDLVEQVRRVDNLNPEDFEHWQLSTDQELNDLLYPEWTRAIDALNPLIGREIPRLQATLNWKIAQQNKRAAEAVI